MAPPGKGGNKGGHRGGGGGRKPKAHKRGRSSASNNTRSSNNSNGDTNRSNNNVNVGANWRNRRSNRPPPGNRQRQTGRVKTRRRSGGGPNNNNNLLQPIKIKSSGIMSSWKKPLGGLIRYYVHTRTTQGPNSVDQKTAEEEVDRFYYTSNCSMEDTKTAILQALGVTKDDQKGWIGVDMAIEKEDGNGQLNTDIQISNNENNKTIDNRGIKLQQVLRAGEGPAHAHEQWTTIIVPEWAVGKSYFFQVTNYSPLNLSCELFLDGEKVAFNAPLLPHSTRTIRPDNVRYYERHQWILNDAKRVKLTPTLNDIPSATNHTPTPKPNTPRYNGIRPDYQGQRISLDSYPDPTTVGWTFTGSVQESRVEFYEKKVNIGIVKLDFYYTTGTMKTVLDHHTSGRNQLFRAQVSPQQYIDVLTNPRAHTNQGYRRREDRPTGNVNYQEDEDDDDKFDRPPSAETQAENDTEMGDANVSGSNSNANTTYFAKDESYDFKKQGHQNRVNQMSKLQQSNDYAQWREANKKEYAVVHAKFYISIPKRTYMAPPKTARGRESNQRRDKQMKALPVPEQSTVIDVKAAENATLGTKYKSIGAPQRFARSNVRMERINGLTDEKISKGDPIFEKKLYYRAENVISGQGHVNDSDEMSEDEADDNLVPPTSLSEYKTEKVEQVIQYVAELNSCIVDPEEAEQRLRNVKNKIHLSESIGDVDTIVKLFYDDLIVRQLN